ncbi:hypothetical protein BH11PSE3_BH11PSE3_34850 [soil metagenome]
MLALHSQTLNVISVIVTLVSAGVTLLTWYHHRGSPGLRGWAIALLLGGAGSLLYSIRGPDTSFRVLMATDTLFVAGFASMWVSMRRFNDPQLAMARMAMIVGGVTAIFVVLYFLAYQGGPGMRAHSVIFSLFVFSLALAAAWETWRGRHLDGLRSRSIAAFALVGIAFARFARATTVVFYGLGFIELPTRIIIQGYTIYFTTVCILVVTFGLVLMANERFEREYALQAEGRGAAE